MMYSLQRGGRHHEAVTERRGVCHVLEVEALLEESMRRKRMRPSCPETGYHKILQGYLPHLPGWSVAVASEQSAVL